MTLKTLLTAGLVFVPVMVAGPALADTNFVLKLGAPYNHGYHRTYHKPAKKIVVVKDKHDCRRRAYDRDRLYYRPAKYYRHGYYYKPVKRYVRHHYRYHRYYDD